MLNRFATMASLPDPASAVNLDTDVITSERFSIPYVLAPGRPLNRKYLRAIHDYAPPPPSTPGASDSASTSATIPLRVGDIVLVHLTHVNGWADGTVLNSGVRGWLPTNYCDNFDPELVRHVFHALTTLWKTCVGSEDEAPGQNAPGDQLQGFVYGVRYLLERTNCLHRHDLMVQSCPHIHRTRKALLSDLANLVEYQKSILADITGPTTPKSWMTLYEELVLKAFKVATRSIRFLDAWTREQMSLSPDKPVFSPVISRADVSGTMFHKAQLPAMMSSTGNWADRQTLIHSNAVVAGPPSLDDYDMPCALPDSVSGSTGSARLADESLVQNTAVQTAALSTRLTTEDPFSAVQQLIAAHDRLKRQIAGLLCLPVQSICSPNVSVTTEKSIEACDNLLSVLRIVNKSIGGDARSGAPSFDRHITILANTTSKLASVAWQIAHASNSDEADTIIDLARGRSLVRFATTCQSCAKLCVAEAQTLLESSRAVIARPAESSRSVSPTRASATTTPPFYSTGFQPFSAEDTLGMAQLVGPADEPKMKAYTFDTVSSSFCLADTQPKLISSGLPSHMSDPFGIEWSDPSTEASVEVFESRPNSAESTGRSRTSTGMTTPDLEDARSGATQDIHQSALRESVITLITDQLDQTILQPGKEAQAEHQASPTKLIQGKDGQILGGTLSALVECMTSESSAPEASILRTFFLSFRSFTTAAELAEALIERYKQVVADRLASTPARLRVLNVFRQWLECHWSHERDGPALPIIREFACDTSIQLLPSARSKLLELVEKAPMDGRYELRSHGSNRELEGAQPRSLTKMVNSQPAPQPLISKIQMTQLHEDKIGLVDIEPLEMARQLTLIVSRYYCAVTAEELHPSNLNSKERRSQTVRTLARISTDLANMVTHTILYNEEVKKRSAVLRHWIRVAGCCNELSNYDSLMAIVCALNSSTVSRLKRTWALVPGKQQESFKELSLVVDTHRNYGALRQKLQACQLPCLPFVGMFLSDLTFVDAGNPNMRTLHCSSGDSQSEVKCINFDKHARTVKIIEQFQSFQVPFNLLALPSFHDWLVAQFDKIRRSDRDGTQEAYQQSLRIEPRAENLRSAPAVKSPHKESVPFWKHKAHTDMSKPRTHHVLHKQPAEPRPKHMGVSA